MSTQRTPVSAATLAACEAFDRIDDAMRACENLCLGWLPSKAQLTIGGWLCRRFGRRAFG